MATFTPSTKTTTDKLPLSVKDFQKAVAKLIDRQVIEKKIIEVNAINTPAQGK